MPYSCCKDREDKKCGDNMLLPASVSEIFIQNGICL